MRKSKQKVFLAKFLYILLGIIGLSILVIAFSFLRLDKFLELGQFEFISTLYFPETAVSLVFIAISIFLYYRYLERPKLKIKNIFESLVFGSLLIISTYIILCLVIYAVQDELISKNNIYFQPLVISNEYADRVLQENNNVQEILLTTPDKTRLNGWLVRKGQARKSNLIIYFGGSGEEVSDLISYTENINGWSVLLMNYRGYGLSQGTPNKTNLFKDALYIYDSFAGRPDIDKGHIVVMGYSLGTGVATYLAKEREVKGTILIAPPDKTSSLFERVFPYLPFDLILKQNFNSLAIAPMVNSPLLCLVGDRDMNVPRELSMRLTENWGGRHQMKIIKGATHGSIFSYAALWKNVNSFLSKSK